MDAIGGPTTHLHCRRRRHVNYLQLLGESVLLVFIFIYAPSRCPPREKVYPNPGECDYYEQQYCN